MSDTAPLEIASKKSGAVAADWTSATMSGLVLRPLMSQLAAASCIQKPVWVNSQHNQSMRNTGLRTGAQVEAGAGFVSGCAVMSESFNRFKDVMVRQQSLNPAILIDY